MKFEIRRLAQDVFSVLEKNWFKLLSASIIRTLLATLANSLVFALLINFPYWNLIAATLTYLLVWSALESGFLKMCLAASRSQTVHFGQLFSGLKQTPIFFILVLTYILATVIGIIALVIPGMFVCVRFSMAGLILIDKSESLIESAKSSYKLTLGYSRLIAPLFLIGATLASSGLQIQFIIELVVTIALVVLYLQINEKTSEVPT
jgi:hypothetical protein